MENENKNLCLGLDVSTTTIGCSIFENVGEKGILKLLTHIAPKLKKEDGNDLFLKAELFEKEFILKYEDLMKRVSIVVIEEPLLGSNNVNTVGTLLRFNGMISYLIYKNLGVKPFYISSYDARKYSFPELVGVKKYNRKGELYTEKESSKLKPSLFYEYPEALTFEQFELIDNTLKNDYIKEKNKYKLNKKVIIWKKINEKYKEIEWLYNKKGELMKENFDQSDSIAAILGYMKKNKIWK